MISKPKSKISFVFFGTPDIAVWVLEELKKGGFLPSLVVTAPDKPQGRKMVITPPPAKLWAEKNNIPILQPEKLDAGFTNTLNSKSYTLFIVAAYGKLIPQEVLDIPAHGTLNVHPSLLPKFRGASPIVSAILSGEEETGTTIMVVDKEMDHGPIVAQESIDISNIPNANNLGEKLARIGGDMLVDIILKWVAGEIKAEEQEHDKATFTKKIVKEDGLLNTENGNAEENYRKFQAFTDWPGTYFFFHPTQLVEVEPPQVEKKQIRVKITNAELKDGKFIIKKVIPEGKKDVDYQQFLNNN